jgi:hypothetical protein
MCRLGFVGTAELLQVPGRQLQIGWIGLRTIQTELEVIQTKVRTVRTEVWTTWTEV